MEETFKHHSKFTLLDTFLVSGHGPCIEVFIILTVYDNNSKTEGITDPSTSTRLF